MNIVLLGPPGAGKGTQSLECQHKYGLSCIASGDLLREEVRQDTELGKHIATYLDQGQLVPHEDIMQVIQRQLQPQSQKDSPGILFDGFPRALPQAISLDELFGKYGLQLDGVIFINVPEQELKQRIKERAKSSGRTDDQGELRVATRMQVYYQKTQPLMTYYEKQKKMFQVDGMGDKKAVFRSIAAILDSIQKGESSLNSTTNGFAKFY